MDDAGTLTLDLVDARTGRLVWRGWAERSIEGVLDNRSTRQSCESSSGCRAASGAGSVEALKSSALAKYSTARVGSGAPRALNICAGERRAA